VEGCKENIDNALQNSDERVHEWALEEIRSQNPLYVLNKEHEQKHKIRTNKMSNFFEKEDKHAYNQMRILNKKYENNNRIRAKEINDYFK
jgi:hypothetical protein